MNIHLPSDLEQLVRLKVESGRYASVSDVVGEALRLMDQRDRVQANQVDQIRARIDAGYASLQAGNVAEGEAFFDALDAELAELEKQDVR